MGAVIEQQMFPHVHGWVGLQGHMVNGWQAGGMSSSFNFVGRIEANTAYLILHTRAGTSRQITGPLPDQFLPETGVSSTSYRSLPAWQMGAGSIVVMINADGTLHVPEWGGGRATGEPDTNIVLQASYIRRAL